MVGCSLLRRARLPGLPPGRLLLAAGGFEAISWVTRAVFAIRYSCPLSNSRTQAFWCNANLRRLSIPEFLTKRDIIVATDRSVMFKDCAIRPFGIPQQMANES